MSRTRSVKVVRLTKLASKDTDQLGLCKRIFKVPKAIWDKQFCVIPTDLYQDRYIPTNQIPETTRIYKVE